MANPAFIDCPADTWTQVAVGVTTGNVYRKNSKPGGYLQTYRVSGEAAPTDREEGVQAFDNNDYAWIESTEPIDVYLYAQGKDGRVRVDL